MQDPLAHTKRVDALLAQGRKAEAMRLQNEHVESELNRAKQGETICLTDLMAGKQQIDLS